MGTGRRVILQVLLRSAAYLRVSGFKRFTSSCFCVCVLFDFASNFDAFWMDSTAGYV